MTVKEIGQGTLTLGAWVPACRVALTPATLALTTPGAVLDPVTAVVVLVLLEVEREDVEAEVVVAVLALDLPEPPQALSVVTASAVASSAGSARRVARLPRAWKAAVGERRSVSGGELPASIYLSTSSASSRLPTGAARSAHGARPMVLDDGLMREQA